MLKKNNRIRKNNDFDRAFKLGESFYGKIASFKVVDNGLPNSRLGILISSKISKKAVLRNKIRRQIRAIIDKDLPLLKPGKDLVIVVFPLILGKSFQEISAGLRRGLSKLSLYK